MDFYGTIGPACAQPAILQHMVEAGMTGIRMNLSHGPLAAHTDWLAMIRAAGIRQLLIDLQGPELRIGTLAEPVALVEGSSIRLGADGVPCPAALVQAAAPGQQLLVLAGSNDVHLAELGGFLGGKVREVAGDKVICLAGGHEIQRDHGKLLGGTALKETDLVVVGNVHYPAQGGLGVLDDGIEPLAAVAHLHHALTAVAILEQLCLCLPEHLLGQHAGACAEVVNSCHNELSLSCIAQHRGFLRCVLLIAVAVVYRFVGMKTRASLHKDTAQKPLCGHKAHKCP